MSLEKINDRPSVVAIVAVGNAGLTLDQEPAARVGIVDLIAGEEVRMLGEVALEEVLGVVGLLVHRPEVVAVEEEDSTVHIGSGCRLLDVRCWR